jgi:hypothetical protein
MAEYALHSYRVAQGEHWVRTDFHASRIIGLHFDLEEPMTTRCRARVMRLVGGLPVLATAIAIVGGSAQVAALQEPKVEMCHAADSGRYSVISISSNAEPAHRAHGDARPGEPVPGDGTLKFDAECNRVPIPVPSPPMLCPCWNNHTESGLVSLLNAPTVVTNPSCTVTTSAVSLSPDLGATMMVYANSFSACMLKLNGQFTGMFFSLTRAQASQCVVEAASLIPATNWCP